MTKFISAFDLDHTLLTINSSFNFGKRLPRSKQLSIPPSMYCMGYYLLYQSGLLSLHQLHEKAFLSLFKGRSFEEVQKQANAFVEQDVERHLYLPALKRLRQAQKDNHLIVLLSSSPVVLVEPISRKLGIDCYFATTYTTDSHGRFNGIDQIVDGNYKADLMKSILNQKGLDKGSLYAYSDSSLDMPLLQLAGHPFAVRPDRHLKRESLKNGWEII